MYPPDRTVDQSDADLDAILAAAEDRLLTAIQASLDLDAGLAEIIGDPPSPEMPGVDDELDVAHSGECRAGIELAARTIRADSAEGRYLAGPGKPIYRQVTDLLDHRAAAAVKLKELQAAVERAENTDRERKEHHRGGSRTWLLRPLILILVAAEVVTAYVAMETLIASHALAAGLAAGLVLVGTGMACTLANRRLNRLRVPISARIPEGTFVTAMAVLRYKSIRAQHGGSLTASAVAAAAAAAITAFMLAGVELMVIEIRTFGTFLTTPRLSWKRWRYRTAAARLSRIQARDEAALHRLQQDFLDFLLKTEGLPFGLARLRASAILKTVAACDNALVPDEQPSADSGLFPRPGTERYRGRRKAALIAVAATATATAVMATGFLIGHLAGDAQPGRPEAALMPPVIWAMPGHREIIVPLAASALFEPDQAVLLPAARSALDELARQLLYTYPNATADIAGYTAAVGGGDGLALSRARAQMVAAELEARGVKPSRLTVHGYGDTRQIPGGLEANRRVVVTLNVG